MTTSTESPKAGGGCCGGGEPARREEEPVAESGCCGGGSAAHAETPAAESGCCGGGAKASETVPADADGLRALVRDAYGRAAAESKSCCGGGDQARTIGYSKADLESVPDEANLGLGCGNPTAMAALQPGQVVLDLGSGAGIDVFIAAEKVGPTGRVIGVDMTYEMLERSRALAVKYGVAGYVEFREGIIEQLPVVDESVDVVISNCVINLSPDKPAAFREAFRVLKPGGVLAVSDIVLTAELEPEVRRTASLLVGCVAGALVEQEYLAAIREAGFIDLTWSRSPAGEMFGSGSEQLTELTDGALDDASAKALVETVWSYKIRALKPHIP